MRITKRIYEDFFKRSRLNQYRRMLQYAKISGYKMMSIVDFYNYTQTPGFSTGENKIIINRHDIDTSPKVAKELFEIEKEVYGMEGSATYFFRKKTINVKLISMIDSLGYETGFHYETIANFEKKHKLKDRKKILSSFETIREQFAKELSCYRKKTNTASTTVSSHGDFINTRYHLQNYELLNDNMLREKTGVIIEAYDDSINEFVDERFADQVLIDAFCDKVIDSINRQTKVIQVLTHPRQWKVDLLWNLKDNLFRLIEGILYRI